MLRMKMRPATASGTKVRIASHGGGGGGEFFNILCSVGGQGGRGGQRGRGLFAWAKETYIHVLGMCIHVLGMCVHVVYAKFLLLLVPRKAINHMRELSSDMVVVVEEEEEDTLGKE
jgi:hypothetical protein